LLVPPLTDSAVEADLQMSYQPIDSSNPGQFEGVAGSAKLLRGPWLRSSNQNIPEIKQYRILTHLLTYWCSRVSSGIAFFHGATLTFFTQQRSMYRLRWTDQKYFGQKWVTVQAWVLLIFTKLFLSPNVDTVITFAWYISLIKLLPFFDSTSNLTLFNLLTVFHLESFYLFMNTDLHYAFVNLKGRDSTELELKPLFPLAFCSKCKHFIWFKTLATGYNKLFTTEVYLPTSSRENKLKNGSHYPHFLKKKSS
jgi:hypothetical protein